jgi:hypothetical protein
LTQNYQRDDVWCQCPACDGDIIEMVCVKEVKNQVFQCQRCFTKYEIKLLFEPIKEGAACKKEFAGI